LLDRLLAAGDGDVFTAAAWEAAFEEAATSLRDEVLRHAESAIQAAARRSRYPSAALARALPDAAAGEALLNRLLSVAMPLEGLAALPDDAVSRRARGSALEGAWDAAVALAAAESRRWQVTAGRIATWRRPLLPLVSGLAGLATVLVVTSAWLGGQLTPPEWFRPVHEAFWSLPWP
jgi:hypothetical protein